MAPMTQVRMLWLRRWPSDGGAVGNVIDRFAYGKVVDFLLFYGEGWAYPAFNVADSFICVGAVLLVIDGFINKRPSEKETVEGREQ